MKVSLPVASESASETQDTKMLKLDPTKGLEIGCGLGAHLGCQLDSHFTLTF
jgi:hypothetical protein